MKIEHIYRNNMRYTHESFEFDRIINFMMGVKDDDLKGLYENDIYSTTKYYREFLANNPDATKKEKGIEKGRVFHAAIFTGTFSGNCHASELVSLSGLMVLDFDHLLNLEETRQILKNCINTFVVFTSPSGTGLKCLVKHKLTLDKVATDWKYLYAEIREYYLQLTEVASESLDNSGSDVSRLCFLPYIKKEEYYRNDKCWEWNYTGVFKHNYEENEEAEYTEVEITEQLYLEWFELTVFLAENSINIAETYGEWRDMGFSLASIGELGRELYHNISCVSNKYSHSECNKQFDLWLDTYQEGRTNIYRFVNAAKKAIEEFNQKQYEKFVG